MPSQADLIFISIAAYRDPQLVPTALNCLAQAAHPERLRFGICRQKGEEEPPLPFLQDPRFRILEIPWQQSQGACWARAEIMKLWQGEPWFLQIDSHSRFANHWDTMLLQAVAETGSKKAILSTYPPSFTPGDHEVLCGGPLQIVFQAFTPEGIPQLRPAGFPASQALTRPVPARFLSAGFLFAPGSFVNDVPYDPELYFLGEESAMTVRAFTHGYDLFHPAQTILWHDYLRLDARKHWGDHTEAQGGAPAWSQLDATSRRKVQSLLRGEPMGSYGLGSERTLAMYEAYAGLSFHLKRAQRYTIEGHMPPNPPVPPDWADGIFPWIARIRVERSQLQPGSFEDPLLWYLGVRDERGTEICRLDISLEQLAAIDPNKEQIDLIAEFLSASVPAAWTVWPLSRSKGWLSMLHGQLQEEDFAILAEEEPEEETVEQATV